MVGFSSIITPLLDGVLRSWILSGWSWAKVRSSSIALDGKSSQLWIVQSLRRKKSFHGELLYPCYCVTNVGEYLDITKWLRFHGYGSEKEYFGQSRIQGIYPELVTFMGPAFLSTSDWCIIHHETRVWAQLKSRPVGSSGKIYVVRDNPGVSLTFYSNPGRAQ